MAVKMDGVRDGDWVSEMDADGRVRAEIVDIPLRGIGVGVIAEIG